jgi:hypothetical protein
VTEHQRLSVESKVVLWNSGTVVCTCVRRADRIAIEITDAGALVDRAEFTDSDLAAEHAIAKMHLFHAG